MGQQKFYLLKENDDNFYYVPFITECEEYFPKDYKVDDIRKVKNKNYRFFYALNEITGEKYFLKEIKDYNRYESDIARVNSPYIVKVYGERTVIDDDSNIKVIVMDYIEDNLNKCIHNLSDEDKSQIFKCLLYAVRDIWASNLCHCDIKPSNILVYKDNNGISYAKLTDFDTLISTNGVNIPKGATKGYSHPELINMIEQHESRINPEISVYMDIYSLGVILYELYTSQKDRLFDIDKHYDDLYTIPPDKKSNIDVNIKRMVKKSLTQISRQQTNGWEISRKDSKIKPLSVIDTFIAEYENYLEDKKHINKSKFFFRIVYTIETIYIRQDNDNVIKESNSVVLYDNSLVVFDDAEDNKIFGFYCFNRKPKFKIFNSETVKYSEELTGNSGILTDESSFTIKDTENGRIIIYKIDYID